MTSSPVTFVIPVSVDTPPCLQRTEPDAHAQFIVLAHISDPRTLKVWGVADDCEPYPVPVGSSKQPTQFVWSVYDATRAVPQWVYQTDTTDSLTVSQAVFPSVRPGDTVKVRVEVRDTPAQTLAQSHVYACSSDQVDTCCGANGCTGTNDCIRWTTWTVNFF